MPDEYSFTGESMNFAEPGELDDLVEDPVDLLLRQPQDRRVQVHVVAPRQLGVEAGPELEEGGDLAPGGDLALLGREDPGQALQEGALARPVLADHRERGALGDLERDVLQGPELVVLGPPAAQHRGLQRVVALLVEAEHLRDVRRRGSRARSQLLRDAPLELVEHPQADHAERHRPEGHVSDVPERGPSQVVERGPEASSPCARAGSGCRSGGTGSSCPGRGP